MQVSQKDYYFLTNRSTLFRYFVDNSNRAQPRRYIFYPNKYETMTERQIHKYERKLTNKFLWWSLFNRDKMQPEDRKYVTSRLIDTSFIVLSSLLMVRFTRKILFSVEFIGIETAMEVRGYDVKFWKAALAYSVNLTAGWVLSNRMLRSTNLTDLAVYYSPNFTSQLGMSELGSVLTQFQKTKFPWLFQEPQK